MTLNADVSSAIRDLLEMTTYGKTVTLKQPNRSEGVGGRPIYGAPTEYTIEALLLPPDNLFSSTYGVRFSDRGSIQEEAMICYVTTPVQDTDGNAVTIKLFDEDEGLGSQIDFDGETYNVTDEVYGNQVEAGFRSFILRKVKN